MFENLEEGLNAFLNGSTIDEVRFMWGFGRNKTIKILKNQLGDLKYKEIAKKTSIDRRINASAKVNKGKKRGPMPDERKRKIANSHVGLKHTKETKEKISNSIQKRIKESGPLRTNESLKTGAAKARETKIKNGIYKAFAQKMKGRKWSMTQSSKEKIQFSKIRFYKNGGEPWMKGKSHSDKTKKILSNITKKMWENGKFDNGNGLWRSKLEKNVFAFLSERFECFHSYRVKNFVFDVFIPKLNLLIEINGDYWHLNPLIYSCDYYDKFRKITALEIWERDRLKSEIAKQQGYNFCCIWQKDIIENFSKAIENEISKFKGVDCH